MIFQRVMFAFVSLIIIFVSGFTSREGASTTKAVASTTGEEPQVLELTFPGDYSTLTDSTKDAIKASIKTEVEIGTGAGTVASVTLEAGSIIATVTFDSSVTTAQVRATADTYTTSPMVVTADGTSMTSTGASSVGVTEEGDKETTVVTISPSSTTAPTASPSTAPTATPTSPSTRYRETPSSCYTDECWCVSAGGNSCGVNEDELCGADECYSQVDCPGNGYRCASGVDDCAADDCWCVSVGGTSCGAGNDEQCKEDICFSRVKCPGNGYTCVNKKPKQKACAADECWCVSDGGFSCGDNQTCLEDDCFEAAQCPFSGYRCKIDET